MDSYILTNTLSSELVPKTLQNCFYFLYGVEKKYNNIMQCDLLYIAMHPFTINNTCKGLFYSVS